MKHYYLLIFICVANIIKAQHNLVDNPGFENTSASFDCTINNPNSSTHEYQDEYTYWTQCQPWEIPKLRDFCVNFQDGLGFFPHVGTSDIHCDDSSVHTHSGVRCGYGAFREFIEAQLNTPLQVNHLYYVEGWRLLSNPTDPGISTSTTSGIRFFNDRPTQCAQYAIGKNGNPNIVSPYYSDGLWHKFGNYYISKSNAGSNYFCLGDFKKGGNSTTGAHAYWDDIKIIDVGTSDCSPYNYIQNVIFADIDGIIYKSQIQTASGNNVDASQTAGDVHITNTANVTFMSEQEVLLAPGFNADPGSIFNALIAPCSSYGCPVASAYIGDF